ncbi:cyclic nucleotide-binding protein [Flavobacterium akiainvivens]|uniref:Cyclic nucleotide-binding protein n=1 Tax=Flavobacterium akiainvivens TaxID=1202724 RepID=A0A0M9VK40_9FLAO|nr:Crp/Fnr family transcriptional regulator [Flavobacterium akiainvivens]KOS08442.1 cyclic nucleotide-binding protein [Flavobacterium akiainvivens]SFQ71898.1 cAMP-binding domain of CRP or a regulatory subunit of cAMP-dependent protein kinases [Flavobacterium akiainvivens]
MIDALKTYLTNRAPLPDEAVQRIYSLALERRLTRNEALFNVGDVCRYKVFVVKGLLHTFNNTEDGHEHILQLSPENTWTLDVESYELQTPSRFSIAAVEHSEVLLWQKDDFDMLLREIPEFKLFAEGLIAEYVHSSRRRIFEMLSNSPEEQYDAFIQANPELAARLPLRMIAAYLGMSLKTLTRIRHAQLQR